jgi:hypothetical protein
MVWKTRKDRPQNTGTASVYVMSIQEHGPIVQARQETCRITYAPAILFRYAYSRKELHSKEVT